MILFVYGKDTFRSRLQVHKMIEKFKIDRDPQCLNIVVINALNATPCSILTEIRSAPFLAEKRMVVIERFLESEHTNLQKDILDRIKNNGFSDDTVILFWEEIDKPKNKEAKALFDLLSKQQFVQHFDILLEKELGVWINSRVLEIGGSISSSAITYLIQNIGSDMWRLNSVLEQLASYSFGKEIEVKDVILFVTKKIDDNIFNLIDAIVARNSKQVFAMIQEQYRNGKDASYILAMLIRQFKILLQLRDLYDRDELSNSATVAKQLALHPFVIKKSLPTVRRYAMDNLQRAYAELLDIDTQTKTGQADQSLLIDIFVGRLCNF